LHYRFAGRLLGRALFDQQIVKGHLAQYLYKHLLSWPLWMEDMASQDPMFYDSLKKLLDVQNEDLESLCLDFTVTEQVGGKPKTIELVPDGANKSVDSENVQEYCQALLRYRMMDRTKPQLGELVLGFCDVVPEAPLAIFSPSELELTLCGLPSIDMEDWRSNTRYSRSTKAEEAQEEDLMLQWFWEIVEDFEHDKKARLLQFATGTAGVPPKGFGALRGADGAIKKFAIHVTETKPDAYPRAQ
jgi:HECT-domain (ubiquitin-transferase)